MPELLLNKTIAFTRNELIEGGVMSIYDYDNNLRRSKMIRLNRACKGTEPLIAYNEDMCKNIRAKIVSIFGKDILEIAKQNPLKKYLLKDIQAEEFFATHKYETTKKNITAEKQAIYCANAVAYNAISQFLNDRKTYRKTRGGTGIGKSTWPDIIAALKAYAPEWGWKLPYSERNLRQNIQDYKEQGYIAIINKRDGNNNAEALKETEQQAFLRQVLRNPNNLNNEQVLFMYNQVAAIRGWRKISVSSIANKREEWNLTTTSARHGAQHFNDNVGMQIKRKNVGYPMIYWTMDGWDAELAYQATKINAKGHSVTSYHNRLTVVVVLDPYNKYPVGYAIGTHETPALIQEALRNALQHTQDLFGCMHRVGQLQTDRYGNGALKPFYEACTEKYTPAQAHNAKAKVIEPYFKALNVTYCQTQPNWTGFGVTANKDNQPNEEYKNKIRHCFPDMEGCRKQITAMMEAERMKKQEAYLAQWQELPTQHKLPLTTEHYLMNIGETTGYTNKLEGSGLNVTLNGVKRTYDSFDENFRALSHIDWTVKFDPQNTGLVLAHNADATVRFLLTEKHLQPMALVERTEGDSEELQKVRNYNKQLKENIMVEMQNDGDAVSEMFKKYPELNDTLAKLQIVDSMGQHKDRRNDARVQQAATKTIAKQERKQVAAATAEKQMAYNEYIDGKINIDDYL
jgi:hypothetical protein